MTPKIDFDAIITTFYDRVFDDVFIGYFFSGLDKQTLIKHQIAFVTHMLGYNEGQSSDLYQGKYAGKPYEGKPLRTAHRPHAIRKAHFDRRQMILRETLRDHGVPDDFADAWLDKEAKFYAQVVRP